MKKLLIIFAILLMAGSAWGATYYVDANGTSCSAPVDTDYDVATTTCGGGGSSTVYTTIQGAIDGIDLNGDDILEITVGTYASDTIAPEADDAGTDGHQLIIRGRSGETVTLSGGNIIVTLAAANDYITIQNIDLLNGTSRNIYAIGATGLIFDDVSSTHNESQTPGTDEVNYFSGISDYQVLNSTFACTDTGNYWYDYVIFDGTTRGYIYNSSFGGATHDSFWFSNDAPNNYIVIKDCTIANPWKHGLVIYRDNHHFIIEGSTFRENANSTATSPYISYRGDTGSALRFYGVDAQKIVRGNIFDSNDSPIDLRIQDEDNQYLYLYHNTFYNTQRYGNTGVGGQHIFSYEASTGGTGKVEYCYFLNNIFSGSDDNEYLMEFNPRAAAYDPVNSLFANNIIYDDVVTTIRFGDGIGTRTVAYLDANSSQWDNNSTTDPSLVDPGSDDFTLPNDSGAIDGARYLTLVNDSEGGSGTSMVVDDADFFFSVGADAYNLPFSATGLANDTIYVNNPGATADFSVEVTNINYATETLTLASSQTWEDDAEIYWCPDGQCFYQDGPDIGALEKDTGVAAGDPSEYADILFWWSVEAADFTATSGSSDYSAGDKTATAAGSAEAINTDAVKVETNGLDAPSAGDYYSFTVSADDIVDDSEGRIGFYLYINTWAENTGLFKFYSDADNEAYLLLSGGDEMYFKWEYSTTVNGLSSTTANLTTGVWYYIEVAWKVSTDLKRIYVNNVLVGTEDTTIDVMGNTPTALEIGTFYSGEGDIYIDQFMISNDSTRSLYELRDETTYAMTPTISDTYACDAAGDEIVAPVTYVTGETARICVVGTEAFFYDGQYAWSDTTLTIDDDKVFTYASGGYTTKLMYLYTLSAGDRNLDVDIKAVDSLADGDSNLTSSDGSDYNLDLTGATDLGGMMILAAPITATIPGDYADYATLGGFVSGDIIEVFDDANITLVSEDGWIVYLRAGYSGTFDANSNTGTLFYHPSATISNVGSVTATPFNGAAGL